MDNSSIAEMLAAAYALHCADASVNESSPVSKEEFAEYYLKSVQEFRHFVGADAGRELNG